MKFTIDKPSLMRELAYIQQSVIEKKSLTPALAHVRIEAAGKRTVRLTGTDLDQTLTCETEAAVQKTGACALPARKLLEIVRNLPDAPVQIETKANDRTEVTCERAHFRLAGLNPKDLPELPKFKESVVQLPADVVRQMIERTRFSITQDESRYTLAGGASVYPFAWSVLLAARAEGLGGVMTTMPVRREPEVKALLGVPDELVVAGLLVLGVPVHQPTRLTRNPVESFTTVDRLDGDVFRAP